MKKRAKLAGSTPPVIRTDKERPTDSKRQRNAKARDLERQKKRRRDA